MENKSIFLCIQISIILISLKSYCSSSLLLVWFLYSIPIVDLATRYLVDPGENILACYILLLTIFYTIYQFNQFELGRHFSRGRTKHLGILIYSTCLESILKVKIRFGEPWTLLLTFGFSIEFH